MVKPPFLALAAFFGLMSVALGAFAAHALQNTLSASMLDVFDTGNDYLIYHALALFGLSALMHWHKGSRLLHSAGWAFTIGIILFCGSLYALALSGHGWLGAITPLGGVAFLAGWSLIFIFAVRAKE